MSARPLRYALLAALILAAGAAIAQDSQPSANVTRAVAVMVPTDGNTAAGVVTFEQTDAGVRIVATMSGLSEGNHGFHVHQYGDCSAADGTSTGGHFNPVHMHHAGPDEEVRHVGDLGNITADADGNATYDRVDTVLAFSGPTSIIGRGLIVHAGEDDLTTQPTGGAGARIACGVIGVAATPE